MGLTSEMQSLVVTAGCEGVRVLLAHTQSLTAPFSVSQAHQSTTHFMVLWHSQWRRRTDAIYKLNCLMTCYPSNISAAVILSHSSSCMV